MFNRHLFSGKGFYWAAKQVFLFYQQVLPLNQVYFNKTDYFSKDRFLVF